MKTLVAYYSHTSNNKYLAERIASEIHGDLCEIKPRLNAYFLLLLSSVLKISLGIKRCDKNVKDYDAVVLVGPIWMGEFVSPLSDFLKKNKNEIIKLFYITCCGSDESNKDSRFGYNRVFARIKELMGQKLVACEALPINLITPDELKGNDAQIMKLRLSNENFKGKIVEKLTKFLGEIQ